jgi:hypothetical protein
MHWLMSVAVLSGYQLRSDPGGPKSVPNRSEVSGILPKTSYLSEISPYLGRLLYLVLPIIVLQKSTGLEYPTKGSMILE